MGENKGKPNNRTRKIAAFIIFPILIVMGAVVLFFYREYKATHISTDDAFVDGRVHIIASKIQGTVKILYVNDNQFVKMNHLMLEIDPADYEVRAKDARAGLETERERLSEIRHRVDTAKKQLTEIMASLEAARANVERQKANLELARINIQRSESLLKKEVEALVLNRISASVVASAIRGIPLSTKRLGTLFGFYGMFYSRGNRF